MVVQGGDMEEIYRGSYNIGYEGHVKIMKPKSGLLVALRKIKHFFKAPLFKNKALLKHFLWTPAQCLIMEKGIDLN